MKFEKCQWKDVELLNVTTGEDRIACFKTNGLFEFISSNKTMRKYNMIINTKNSKYPLDKRSTITIKNIGNKNPLFSIITEVQQRGN